MSVSIHFLFISISIWLTVSLHFQLVWSSAPLPAAAQNTQPILFESIGTMVAALSYLHTYIPLNLTAIEEQIILYQVSLTPNKQHYIPLLNITRKKMQGSMQYYTLAANKEVEVSPLTIKLWEEIIALHLKEVDDFLVDIRTLKSILPTVSNEQDDVIQGQGRNPDHKRNPPRPSTTPHPDNSDRKRDAWGDVDYADKYIDDTSDSPHPKSTTKSPFSIHHKWNPIGVRPRIFKRALPLLIAAGAAAVPGVLGTSLGIYSINQINKIWTEVNTNRNSVNRLITVADAHDVHLQELDSAIREVGMLVQSLFLFNPSMLTNRLLRIESQIKSRVQKATHLIQQVQHRRLPVDYLTDADIKLLFATLAKRADSVGCRLAIDKHSDLYQLESSYLYDGSVVSIILHVPMYPVDSILRLFKLHPFPLPFVEDKFLIPDVSHDILGVSQTDPTYHIQLTATELMACHQVNHFYFCERNGVLSKDEDFTCLGALYNSKYDLAQKVCSFHIEPVREYIYQLLDNWFIIYTASAITIPTKCRNGTTKELFIPKAISKFHLSAGCSAQFPKHKIFSDLSIKLPTDFIHLNWEWEPITELLQTSDGHGIQPELARLTEFGIGRPRLADLQNLLMNAKRIPSWGFNIFSVSAIFVLIIVLFIIVFIIIRCRAHQRNKKLQSQLQHNQQPPNNLMIPMMQFQPGYVPVPQAPIAPLQNQIHNPPE